MDDFAMTIGGQRAAGHEYFEVENPATADVICSAPACTREQLDLAMRAARDAQAGWQAADESARRGALAALADAIEADLEPLALVVLS
jgi:acyl-CoA reductase-like NAD-dependent aldehyde dehydrogenase